jgi:hypothetical protein
VKNTTFTAIPGCEFLLKLALQFCFINKLPL